VIVGPCHRVPHSVIAAAIALVCACSNDLGPAGDSGEELEWEPLVDPSDWTPAELEQDPLASHRPAMVDCGIDGWRIEAGELEIDTNACNYAALSTPTIVEIEEGADMRLILRHYDLVAPDPAEAHAALSVDDELLWEATIAVPGPADVIEANWTAPRDFSIGDTVTVHLHNHGQNTWIFGPLETRGSTP
jgi:hypothetical protein